MAGKRRVECTFAKTFQHILDNGIHSSLKWYEKYFKLKTSEWSAATEKNII